MKAQCIFKLINIFSSVFFFLKNLLKLFPDVLFAALNTYKSLWQININYNDALKIKRDMLFLQSPI